MNHRWIIGTLTIATLMCCQTAEAQLFGGRGVGEQQMPFARTTRNYSSQPAEATKESPFSGWFSRKPKDLDKPAFSLPKLNLPKLQLPKFERPAAGSAGLFKRPDWLPERDPTAPNLFQRMSESTKNMASRTSSWFKGKSGEVQQEGSAQWDAIRQEMEQIQQESRQQAQSIRPNLRSARSGSTPAKRF